MKNKNRPYLSTDIVLDDRKEHKENVKKIKLPAYCYFSPNGGKVMKLGLLNSRKKTFELIDVSRQKSLSYNNVIAETLTKNDYELGKLIEENNVNIGRAKVILFE